MIEFFDTHCHFDSLDAAKTQIPRAYQAGLRGINVIGTDVETTQRSIDVVRMIEDSREELGLNDLFIRATMGLHPHEANFLSEQKDELEKLLHNNRELISGIGETGYDFYYNHSSREDQTKSFIWQIELAKSCELPMIVHTRDAWEDTFRLLDEQGWPSKTVLHCFTGGMQEALRCVDNGAFISISGIATFKNADDIRDAIEVVPLNRLFCETDAPWLAPAPHRGRENEPGYVTFIIDQIVDIRTKKTGESESEIREALLKNARDVFIAN